MPEEPEPDYEYVKAVIDCGVLTIYYKMPGHSENRVQHDEDEEVINDYTEKDMANIARGLLALPDDYPVETGYV